MIKKTSLVLTGSLKLNRFSVARIIKEKEAAEL